MSSQATTNLAPTPGGQSAQGSHMRFHIPRRAAVAHWHLVLPMRPMSAIMNLESEPSGK